MLADIVIFVNKIYGCRPCHLGSGSIAVERLAGYVGPTSLFIRSFLLLLLLSILPVEHWRVYTKGTACVICFLLAIGKHLLQAVSFRVFPNW